MNSPLTSPYEFKDHKYPLYVQTYAALDTAVVATGGTTGDLSILEPACEQLYQVFECRKHDWAEFYLIKLTTAGAVFATVMAEYNISDCITSESP